MARTDRAFTLIELLVVIAIVALLMAIIMPSLSAARKHAQGVSCTSNLKQLSIAWTLYADGNASTLGYADGHAELHIWRDKTTWKVSSGEFAPGTPCPDSVDLQYMQRGYVDMSKRMF